MLGNLRPGPHAPHGLLQAVRDGVGGGGHQAGGLGDLVTDLGVQPGSQSAVGVLVGLEPGARLVLGQVDGGGDLLLPGHVAVGLLAVVWAAVAADLDLYNIPILANNTGSVQSSVQSAEDFSSLILCNIFFTLQRMLTAMESGNLKAWKKA